MASIEPRFYASDPIRIQPPISLAARGWPLFRSICSPPLLVQPARPIPRSLCSILISALFPPPFSMSSADDQRLVATLDSSAVIVFLSGCGLVLALFTVVAHPRWLARVFAGPAAGETRQGFMFRRSRAIPRVTVKRSESSSSTRYVGRVVWRGGVSGRVNRQSSPVRPSTSTDLRILLESSARRTR